MLGRRSRSSAALVKDGGQKQHLTLPGGHNALSKESSLFLNTLIRKGVLRVEVWKKKNLIQREQQFNAKLMWDLSPDFQRVLRMTLSGRQSKGSKDLAVKIHHLNLEDIMQCYSFPGEQAASWTMQVKKKTYNCVAADSADMAAWVAAIRGAVAVQRSQGVSPLACYHVTMTDSPNVQGHGNVLLVFHPQFQPNQLLFRSPLSEATVHICDFSSIATYGLCHRTHHFWYTTHQQEQTVVRVNSVTVSHIARILRKYLEALVGELEVEDRLDRGYDRVAYRVPGRASSSWMEVPGVILQQNEHKTRDRSSCFPELEMLLLGRHERPDIQDGETYYLMRRMQQPRYPSLPDTESSKDVSVSLSTALSNSSVSDDVAAEDDYALYDSPLQLSDDHYSAPVYTHASPSFWSHDNIYDQPEGTYVNGRVSSVQRSAIPYCASPVLCSGSLDDDYVDMEGDTNDQAGTNRSPVVPLNHRPQALFKTSPSLPRKDLAPGHVLDTHQAVPSRSGVSRVKSPKPTPRLPMRQRNATHPLNSATYDNPFPPGVDMGDSHRRGRHVHTWQEQEVAYEEYVNMSSPRSLGSPNFFADHLSGEQEHQDKLVETPNGTCTDRSRKLSSGGNSTRARRCVYSADAPGAEAMARVKKLSSRRQLSADILLRGNTPTTYPPHPRRASFDVGTPSASTSSTSPKQPPVKPPRRHQLKSSS